MLECSITSLIGTSV